MVVPPPPAEGNESAAAAAASQVFVIRDPDTGLEAHIAPAGASLQRLLVPVSSTLDADSAAADAADASTRRDVVLGYASAAEYLSVDPTCYLGAVVGRVANRVANARFRVGEREFSLAANNGPNSLHGGARGFDRRLFSVVGGDGDDKTDNDKRSVTLRCLSPAGEEGYPGTLEVEARYSLKGLALRLEMRARCVGSAANVDDDEKFALPPEGTPVALAGHSYFNLAGCNTAPSVLSLQGPGKHVLHMPRAKRITLLGDHQVPTGALAAVDGTPFDFASTPRALGEKAAEVPGVDRPGYDHNFALVDEASQASAPGGLLPLPEGEDNLPLVAALSAAGLRLEVRSNAPGVQVYTGNYLGGEDGQGDASAPEPKDSAPPYRRWSGVCLETQNWPDAVNQWSRRDEGGGGGGDGKNKVVPFPCPLLRAGEEYAHVVEYCFSHEPSS